LWSKTLQNQGITDNENEGDQLTTISKAMQHCFTSTRLQHFQFAPTVVDLVSQLKSSGYKIAIITNGHAEVQRSKLVACAAHDLFNPDWIVVGGEEIINGGNEKPHPSIFTKACRLVDCQPAEAVIVGDSLKCDVQGGINAGLAATVWVNNNDGEKKVPVGGPVPTYIVKCIAELPAVLEELEK
jgi:N-acylneuraminate-9-phosphatase